MNLNIINEDTTSADALEVLGTEDVYTTEKQAQPTVDNSSKYGMRKAAYILMIIFTVLVGWMIIPLAWMIPMTLSAKRKMENLNEDTVALGVCTLLFAGIIPGILLLIAN